MNMSLISLTIRGLENVPADGESINCNAVASMSNDVRIFVAGHRGMVGSAIVRKLEAKG